MLIATPTSLRAAETAAATDENAHDKLSGTQDAKRTGSARFFDPKDGAFDLSYFLGDPADSMPVPIVVTGACREGTAAAVGACF